MSPLSNLRDAVRRGAVYLARGRRESAAVSIFDLTLDQLRAIQAFRGGEYAAASDGPIDAVVDGLNVHPDDRKSLHVLLLEDGELIACVRYYRRYRGILERTAEPVELGGFVVAARYRKTRATLEIVDAVRRLALAFGDRRFEARASVEFGSSSVLKRFGARVLCTYYEPAYKRNAELLSLEVDLASLGFTPLGRKRAGRDLAA